MVELREIVILVFVFLMCSGSSHSISEEIQITDLDVPSQVRLHGNAVFHCKFDLQEQPLESVTWFFDEKQFYKYSVEENGILKQVFHNSSFIVDEKNSSDTTLILRNLNLNATGRYKCKIHSDLPYFKTDSKESYLQVIVLPNENPKFIKTPRKKLRVGSRIEVICRSPPSMPAAKVTFEINNKTVPQSYVKSRVSETEDNLRVTDATLKMKLGKKYFTNGKANITCSTELPDKEYLSKKHVIVSSAGICSGVFTVLSIILATFVIR